MDKKKIAIVFLVAAILSYIWSVRSLFAEKSSETLKSVKSFRVNRKLFMFISMVCIVIATVYGIQIKKKSKQGFKTADGINISVIVAAMVLMLMMDKSWHWLSSFLIGFIAIAGSWQFIV